MSLFVNVTKYQFNDKAFKIQLYFVSYKSSRTDNETKSVKTKYN